MAITGPIPLPESGMDAFLKQLQQGTVNRQKQQELIETANYHKRSLDIHQEASNRAQALMPHMIQQYKDTHDGKIDENALKHIEFLTTKKIYDDAMKGGGQFQPGEKQASQSQQMPQSQESLPQLEGPQQNLTRPGSQIPGTPPLADIMQNFMPTGLPQRQANQGMQQQLQQQVNNGGLNFQTPPDLQPEIDRQRSQAAQQQPQQPQQAQNAGPKVLPNGETEIAPGNPNLYFADKMAGRIKSIPAPQVHFGKDGMIYTRYPSGRTTVMNAGVGAGASEIVSPEDAKEANREQLAEYKDTLAENKENRKEAREIRTKAYPVEHILHNVEVIREIYNRNKNLTGPGAAFGKKLGVLDKKDLGALTTAFGEIQMDVAHNASSKAGAQLFRWASGVKPDTFNPQNFNLGMIDTLEKSALYDYSSMNRDHKSLVKKDLPAYNDKVKQYEKGNTGNSIPKITVFSGGRNQIIDKANLEEAKKLDPNLEVISDG